MLTYTDSIGWYANTGWPEWGVNSPLYINMYIAVLACLATITTLRADSTQPVCYKENYIGSSLEESSVTYQDIHWEEIREHLLRILRVWDMIEGRSRLTILSWISVTSQLFERTLSTLISNLESFQMLGFSLPPSKQNFSISRIVEKRRRGPTKPMGCVLFVNS